MSNTDDVIFPYEQRIIIMGFRAAQREIRDMEYEKMKSEYAILDEAIYAWEASLPPLPRRVDFRNLSPAQAAFTLWRVIVDHQRKEGGSVAWEVMLLTPAAEAKHFGHHGDEGVWCVCFESGPHDWGVYASMEGQPFGGRELVGIMGASQFMAMPYYGFDLCFSRA